MKKLVIKSIILISCFSTFQSNATGSFWTEYFYHLTICNSEGQRIINQEIVVNIDKKSFSIVTDSMGSVQIYLGRTGNCPSNQHLITRLLHLKDWSWTPELMSIKYKGLTFEVNKNWKRHFRKKNIKEEFYNYENGNIKKQRRRKNKT